MTGVTDWGETAAVMLVEFGIEPARLFGITMRQYNALCAYLERAARLRQETAALDGLRSALAPGGARK